MAFPPSFTLSEVLAGDEAGISDVRILLTEYATIMMREMGVKRIFPKGELTGLPGKYSPDVRGRLFLLRHVDGCGTVTPAGCIAFHEHVSGIAELKRLFVSPPFRGQRLGESLSIIAIASAKEMGYSRIILETLERSTHARALYEGLGFTRIDRYNDNPVPDITYYGKDV